MNIQRVIGLVVLGVAPCFASRTVLVPRSITTDPTQELALTYHQEYVHARQNDDFSMSLYAKPVMVHSAQSCNLTRYLMPCCPNCCGISVREDGLGSIGAPWLHLLSTPGTSFNSTMTVKPEYMKVGCLFNMRFNFDNLVRGLWLGVSIAPLMVYHWLNLNEQQYGLPGSVDHYQTIIEALNSYGVQHFCQRTRKGGVDDIQLKLGYTFKPRKRWQLEGYVVGVAPTSNAQKAVYFFEPQLGDGHHGALGFGCTGVVHCWTHEKSSLDWIVDAKYLYLFRHRQCRTFDLCNGDWSRYLLAAFEDAPSVGLPILRMLTKKCNVTPGSQISLWNAFHWDRGNFQAELGGSFWWRQREKVCLCNNCLCDMGIFDLAGACIGHAVSASHAKISQTASGTQAAPSDTEFTKMSSCAINTCSATQPHACTFQCYAAVGAEAKTWRYPGLLGVGAFYEVANHASALDRAGVWATAGMRF